MEKVLGLNFDDKNSEQNAPEFDNSDAFKDPKEVGENGQAKSNSDSFHSSQYYQGSQNGMENMELPSESDF